MGMAVSPAGLVDRVVQAQQAQTRQDAHIRVLAKAMDMQESDASALLNAVAGPLPLATEGTVGTRVNALV